MPRRCERRTLPIELIPHAMVIHAPILRCFGFERNAKSASGEFRSRDLWAMNPTRCQLRYGGLVGVDW